MLNLGIYSSNVLRATGDLVVGLQASWVTGSFILVTLSTRLLVEYLGALMLGDVIFHKYLRTGDLEKAQERAGRLVYGARSPVKLPWGGETPFKSYSPMEYVRCLESGGPEWSGTYNFLCESCHPNSLQHLWLLSAGPSFDNWSNASFARHGHEILEQRLQAAEGAVAGIVKASEKLVASALPYVGDLK